MSRLGFPQSARAVAILSLLLAIFAHSSSARAQADPALPEITARAVYSFDIDADLVLYTLNENESLPPASITKLATALLLVRNVDDLQQTVTIETEDIGDVGESNMGLEPGDVVTWNDLLYGLLLPSGNDAARAVARVIGIQLLAGDTSLAPLERFVQEMNGLARELNLEQTQFLNPTGLHQDGHVSSAHDIAMLARKAFTASSIRDVIKESSHVVIYGGPNPRELTIETTVKMKDDPGVVGGKTGTTPEAGACIVLMTQERGGNRIITVDLGSDIEFDEEGGQIAESDMRYPDMRAILDQMDRDFRWVDIDREEDMPGLQSELQAWQVKLQNNDAIVTPNRDGADVSYLMQLGPEAEPEAEAGRVLFFIDSEQVAERLVIQLPSSG